MPRQPRRYGVSVDAQGKSAERQETAFDVDQGELRQRTSNLFYEVGIDLVSAI
jgi:hypothetical protein